MTKLEKLLDAEGCDDLTDLDIDGTCPSICMNPGCDATYDYEPDQDRGWCDECGTNTVKSALILAGLI